METRLYYYRAVILRIIDGDSFHAEIDLGYSISCKRMVRLSHIDTPEIRGKEKEQGLIVKEFVQAIALEYDNKCYLNSKKIDSFGRVLADVWFGENQEVYLNDLLLEKGYAIVYKK